MTRRTLISEAAARLGLAAVLAILPAQMARAVEPTGATQSYCEFSLNKPSTTILPGGGGDTVFLGEVRPTDSAAYHYIFDTASPITLANHDLLVFPTQRPSDYNLKVDGDSLVMCHRNARHEVVIEGQYRRSAVLSEVDTPNNEIEQIAFLQSRVIWLSDILFKEYRRNPKALFADSRIYDAAVKPTAWTVRPFSQALPSQKQRALK